MFKGSTKRVIHFGPRELLDLDGSISLSVLSLGTSEVSMSRWLNVIKDSIPKSIDPVELHCSGYSLSKFNCQDQGAAEAQDH